MSDPYVVLGVSQGASDEQIKNAYRAKARDIQSGNYSDSDARMKELDEAYDAVMAQRRGSYNAGPGSSGSAYSSYVPPEYSQIRDYIKTGRLDDAQQALNAVPQSQRVAEWYYLQGMVQQQKGWANAAYENYSRAYQTDPNNSEYAAAYHSMNANRNGGYRTSRHEGGSGGGCSACDICQGLICADCCCECMGGDLIRCC